MGSNSSDKTTAAQYFKVYEEHSKALRTWLVAYGIGAPALFVTNETAAKALHNISGAKTVALLFLVGVALQVFLASLNKVLMWALYRGEGEPSFRKTRYYRLAGWFSAQFWIDVIVDIVTMFLFAIATWRVFLAVGGS